MNHEHHQHTYANALADDSGGSPSPAGFCKEGMAMTMYMTGFSFSLFNSNKGCLNLFFPNFTLDSTFKFLLGMVAVTCLGISVEGVASLKRRYISGFKKRRRAAMDGNNDHANISGKAKYVLAAFQGLQALIGYMLMLSAMTFSVELLLSAVLGLSLGFLIFEKHKMLLSTSTVTDAPVDDGDGTPCCGYTEDVDGSEDSPRGFDYHQHANENDESSSLILRSTQERS